MQESQGAGSPTYARLKRRHRWLLVLGVGLPLLLLLFVGLVLVFFLNLARPSHELVQSFLSPMGGGP